MSISRSQKASQTAQLVAAVRAGHTRHQGGLIFADPCAEHLLGFPWRQIARHRWLFEFFSNRLMARVRHVHTQILLRARLAEEVVLQAATEGASQYLVLGAGLDAFALRHPPGQPPMQIFEADYPATQNRKRTRLKKARWEVPTHLHWVPIDFEVQGLFEVLRDSGWDRTQRSVVSWMGTTYYLSHEAIARTLAQLRQSMPPGSRCVLDHGLDDANLDPTTIMQYAALRDFVASRGEPMSTRFAPTEFESLAALCGFRCRQAWEPSDQRALCPPQLALPFSGFSRVVLLEAN
ncbi:MAG: class I SAM-dependent methyltransferase [Alphaproteobacteria bacterium]|nr:class I SAM-dependent methyltransferase [Alphaproteobacteria bacterium]